MKQLKLFLIFTFLTLFLTGCGTYTPYVRLEQRTMVQIVGIDCENGKYSLSAQFSMGQPADGGGAEGIIKTIVGRGDNLYLALKQIRESAGKEFFFAHNQIVVLGEGVIQNNVAETLEEYVTYCGNNVTAYVAGCEGKAEDLVSLVFKDEFPDKNKLLLILEHSSFVGNTPVYTVYETLSCTYCGANSCFIPAFALEDNELYDEESGGGEGGNGGGEDSGGSAGNESGDSKDKGEKDTKTTQLPNPSGGFLVADGHLANRLDEYACTGLALLGDAINISSVRVNVEYDDSVHSLEVYQIKTKITPKKSDGGGVTFKVTLNAVLDRAFNSVMSHLSDENKHYVDLGEKELKQMLEAAVENTVRYGGDILNLENEIKHRNYGLWLKVEDNWKEVLKDARFEYDINLKVV